MERLWAKLSVDSFGVPADRIVETNDLNMFGKASLFQLTSRCHTPMGVAEYADWIMNPSEPKRSSAAARRCPLADDATHVAGGT